MKDIALGNLIENSSNTYGKKGKGHLGQVSLYINQNENLLDRDMQDLQDSVMESSLEGSPI